MAASQDALDPAKVSPPESTESQSGDFARLWTDPPSIYRSAAFWSWNTKLDPQRLCREIEEMQRGGMGGFFMQSRYGLKTPYLSDEWFKCVSACIEKARQLDMKAYLYDEDRWPSGIAGGLVTRTHREFGTMRMLIGPAGIGGEQAERVGLFHVQRDAQGRMLSYQAIHDSAPSAPPAGDVQIISFESRVNEPLARFNDATCLDVMRGDAVAEFIRVTHKAYADRFQKHFGEAVPAIFTDEPHYGQLAYVPPGTPRGEHFMAVWTPALPLEFKRRRGYDLREHLPELIFDQGEQTFSKVRQDYFRTVAELFVESYSAQIGQWCGKHKIASTGHVLFEQSLDAATGAVGDTMPHYEHMQWPGIDILCDSAEELNTAKQCTSVAGQLGKERVLSELYGCTGWDWPLEGHKFIGDWQYATGVNFRSPHLTLYSLAGGAKRDYPASIFTHSPWWKYYGCVEAYFGRLSYMLTRGQPLRDVLVIHPIESAWGLYLPHVRLEPGVKLTSMQSDLDELTQTLSGQHVDWDFGSEALLPKYASVSKGSLKVGAMTYKLVIVPSTISLRATTVTLLRNFIKSGGKVVFVGQRPDRIDGQVAPAVAELIAQAVTTGPKAADFMPVVESLVARRLSLTENGQEQPCLWSMLRSVKGGQLLFVQSHDRAASHVVKVRAAGRLPIVLWDPMTGRRTRIRGKADGDRVEFDLPLAATGSALVSLGLSVRDAVNAPKETAVVSATHVGGPFDVELCEPNTLNLDMCSYRVGDEPFSRPMASMAAETAIRKRFRLPERTGSGHQPWYLYTTGVVDVRPRGICQTRRTFHVTDVPAVCRLAIEQPENFTIVVNGQTVSKVDGYWVDEDIKTIDIASALRPGENEVLLTFDYRPDMELEDLYLVGDFGVSAGAMQPAVGSKDSVVRSCEGVSLVAPVRQLQLGSWVGQGLDFYGGAVRYRLKIAGPAKAGHRVRVSLPGVACTAAAIIVNGQTFALPWAPFAADITDALQAGANDVVVEVCGGRKNILGPLHVPWLRWTGPAEFNPANPKWQKDYLLVDHGLTQAVVVEVLA